MSFIQTLLVCFGVEDTHNSEFHTTLEKHYTDDELAPVTDSGTKEAAEAFVRTLLQAETNGPQLRRELSKSIQTCTWSESLGKAILNGLRIALENGLVVGEAMKNAVEKATCAAFEFAKEHPMYCTLIALGVLVLLAPWVLSWLGFGELGPIEGSWAAGWQAQYAGYVPKSSLFSYFQRLGMTMRWSGIGV